MAFFIRDNSFQRHKRSLPFPPNSKNMTTFKNLSAKENKLLLKFPAYISMLALSYDNKLDYDTKKSAFKSGYIRSYFSDPLLTGFYKEAALVYQDNMDRLDKDLPKDKDRREEAIIKELTHLEKIVLKLEGGYFFAMNHSMKSFKNHVSRACHDVLLDFVFPIPVPIISERLSRSN